MYKNCTNCSVCNGTVLKVITQKLPLHVQLHNSTAHLLYKYCTRCTVYNWTVLTVITHKVPLHVQLPNSTTHLLYKYCTNCIGYNWTILTVITQKLPLHVQLHNSTQTVIWYLLKWSAASCLICIYRQSYIEIRSFKAIQLTVNAPPQSHIATQRTPIFLSGVCMGASGNYPSVHKRWRNSGNLRRPTCNLSRAWLKAVSMRN